MYCPSCRSRLKAQTCARHPGEVILDETRPEVAAWIEEHEDIERAISLRRLAWGMTAIALLATPVAMWLTWPAPRLGLSAILLAGFGAMSWASRPPSPR